ncbi:MFS transporter [Halotalea alkalilenta]|uniref:MFS transporter n=1 Tax=Halotalea alkalilenta TaxID=376489 RepID=UPI0005BAF8D1|nr:aromatic acid/H+ symport family MFS transporter [Halotalea alkalilenta]
MQRFKQDVETFVDERPLGGFQWLVVGFGFLIIALDGFDIAVMAFAAPDLLTKWGIERSDLGPVMSAALIGLAISAMFAGPLADRFGRKKVLCAAVFIFGSMTLMTAFATDLTTLMVLRFITGLGLGAAMPNAGTLVAEYVPAKYRSLLITVAFCGFTLGASLGGFVSAWVIPAYGWEGLMVLGGVLPLVTLPLMVWKMPESVKLLLLREGFSARARRVALRLAPELKGREFELVAPSCDQGVEVERALKRSPLKMITSSPFMVGTLSMWVVYFAGLFLVYLLGSWLPLMVEDMGFTVAQAAFIASFFQLGGTVGSVFWGWCMDRLEPNLVLCFGYGLGGALVISIGLTSGGFIAMCALAALVGFCFSGSNTGMNALANAFYPTAVRSTGASLMHGVGRLGAISSAFIGATLLASSISMQAIFICLSIPALVASVALLVKSIDARRRDSVKQRSGLSTS